MDDATSKPEPTYSDAERAAAIEAATQILVVLLDKTKNSPPQLVLDYGAMVGFISQMVLRASRDEKGLADYAKALKKVKYKPPGKLAAFFDVLGEAAQSILPTIQR